VIPISARAREREALRHFQFEDDTDILLSLEDDVCRYQHCVYAVAFHTPESALLAALNVSGIGEGDAVITSAMAPLHRFTALWRSRAVIRYADISLDGTLYEYTLPKAMDAKTKAVICGAFEGIADPSTPKEAPLLIDDLTGCLAPAFRGNLSVWTLEPMMPEGCEKTGFVLTNDAVTAGRLRLFATQGLKSGTLWNYDLAEHGTDSLLSRFGASVARRQMKNIDACCALRSAAAGHLDERLKQSNLFERVKRAPADVPNTYPVRLAPELFCPKEDIFAEIRNGGVEVSVCCKPVYKTTAFRDDTVRLPVTEDFYKALLQLPCHHRLSRDEVGTVADVFLKAVETYAYRGCRF